MRVTQTGWLSVFTHPQGFLNLLLLWWCKLILYNPFIITNNRKIKYLFGLLHHFRWKKYVKLSWNYGDINHNNDDITTLNIDNAAIKYYP